MASNFSKRPSSDEALDASSLAAPALAPTLAPTTPKPRRQAGGNGNLTNYQRKLICEFYRKSGGVMSQKDLAQWTKHEFNLKKTPAQSTISGILRRQHEFINMSSLELGIKKRRVVQHPQLDCALANWVIQMAGRGHTVQGDLTKEKAKEFAQMLNIPAHEQPEFSNGWLHSFQLRHNFSFRKFNADVQSHNHHHLKRELSTLSSTPPPSRRQPSHVVYYTNLDALGLETDKYELSNIFAVDETPVLYTMPPVQNALEESRMRCKKRFVVSLGANADGSEKLQPLFVSHHEHPKCFRKKTAEQHGLHYFSNHKAWMTGVIFSRWIQRLDFAMANQKRHILVFLNDLPSHVVAHLELTHVVVFLLPPAVMQMLNPITSRLVTTFKKRFRRYHLRHAINKAELKRGLFEVDVLQAMKWAVVSWDEISSETIKRAWVPTQLVRTRIEMMDDQETFLHDEDETLLDSELDHLMLFLRLANPIPMIEYLNDETLSDYPVHEDRFDVVSNICEVEEDEVEDAMDDSPGRTLSLQEKLKAFRDVLHVLKDRNDADDNALNAIRRVQDAIRLEGQKEAMQVLSHTQEDTKNLYDLDTDRTCTTTSAQHMASLDMETHQTMDASTLLDPSENSALSAASASLAEEAGGHTNGMMDDATEEETRTHMNSGFHAVI